ncbi:MAG: transcription elongation factor GreA [Patescibacteria group bacterium]|jgi:transcription elongation factor GreA
MAEKKTYLTKEGLEKLSAELLELKTVKRKEISDRIQDAKELGDLSENAEYAEAKEQQSFTEGRIAELEVIVKNAELIENQEATKDHIQVGSKVEVESDGLQHTYSIVGSNEADPTEGFISNESPLGQAFLGKKVGESIEIEVPKGKLSFQIKKIH